jgi:hypothetical protein
VRRPFAWKRLLIVLALVGLVFAVTSWIVEGVTPSWIVFPVLLLIGLVLVRQGWRSGIVWLGVSALVFLLVHLPFDKAALSDHCVNPADSDRACYPAWWLVSLLAFPPLMILSAVFAFRETRGV